MSGVGAAPGQFDTTFASSGTNTQSALNKLTGGNSIVTMATKVILGGRVGATGTVSFAYTEYDLNGGFIATRIHAKSFPDIAAIAGSNTISSTTTPAWAPVQPEMPKFTVDATTGKIVAAGTCSGAAGTKRRPCAVRFNLDGTTDSTFGVAPGFWQAAEDTLGDVVVAAIAVQTDSKVLIAATCPAVESAAAKRMCLFRLNANGTLDETEFAGVQPVLAATAPSRANEDIAVDIAIRSDGYIALLGRCLHTAPPGVTKRWWGCIAIFDGTPETANLVVTAVDFLPTSPTGYAYPNRLLLLPSGKLVVMGGCTAGDPVSITPASSILGGCATRLTWTGTLFSAISIDFSSSPDFGTSGVALTAYDASRPYRDAALQPDGKIVAVRAKPSVGNCCLYELVRLNANGSEDSTWTKTDIPAVAATTSVGVPRLALDANGRSYGGTHVLTTGGTQEIKISRFQGDTVVPPSCTFDLDGNGGAPNAATDGVLALRYLASFKDPNFTTGALGSSPSRATFAAINTYITTNCSTVSATTCTLDIDGDNKKLATTDGVLLIRAMLGIPIVANAIGVSPARGTWADVRRYLTNNCGMQGLPLP